MVRSGPTLPPLLNRVWQRRHCWSKICLPGLGTPEPARITAASRSIWACSSAEVAGLIGPNSLVARAVIRESPSSSSFSTTSRGTVRGSIAWPSIASRNRAAQARRVTSKLWAEASTSSDMLA